MNPRTDNRGFIALITVIIISAFLEIAVVIGSAESISLLENVARMENKEKSYYLAKSCAALAILNLIRNDGYIGSKTENVSSLQCSIGHINQNFNEIQIETSATVVTSSTKLKTIVSAEDFAIKSQTEI